jgi:hypothetical protein
MNHLTEEQLILHYYSEEGDALAAEQHLDECAECRSLYGSLQRVLNVVDSIPVPERGADYGAQVWHRIQPAVPARRWRWRPLLDWRLAVAGVAMAGLLAGAFVIGRLYPAGQQARPMAKVVMADPQHREQVLMVAMGDYLERSQLVLVELANATPKGKLDISTEQERAADLVSDSHLYRQTAEHTGDAAVANVLDEVDRVMVEIAQGPSEVTPAELENLQRRLEAEGILFKIRVLGSKVHNQDQPAGKGRQKL